MSGTAPRLILTILAVEDLPRAVDFYRAAIGWRRLLDPRPAKPWGDEAAYFADPDGNVLVVAVPV